MASKTKKSKLSETFKPEELYDLCRNLITPATTYEEAYDSIRQWLNRNKDDNTRLKKALTYQGEYNRTPLHIILNNNTQPPLDIIQTFINYAPEAVKVRDQFGSLPIHSACFGGASLEVIQALVNSYPESVKVTNIHGLLPLHHACRNNASLEVVEALLTIYPESANITGNYGCLPLHFACDSNASLEVVQALVNSYPEGVNVKAEEGWLPLHYACLINLEVVQVLLKPYPESIKVEDDYGCLPLHKACQKNASLEVLNFFIESYPEGINQKDSEGATPLEIFIDKTDDNGMDFLTPKKYVQETDENGMLPLHHVCKNENYLHLIHFFIQAYPESTTVPDNDGKTPLQYLEETASGIDKRGMALLHRQAAHFKGLNVEILPILLNANPEAIRLQDKFGLLPIHHACLNEASSLEALIEMVKLYPESVAAV